MKISLPVAIATIVVVVAVLGMGSASAAPSSPSTASAICKGLTGATWKIGGRTSTKYFAATRGVTCAFVKPWVARLTRLRKANATITGGPAGFTCKSAQRQAGEAVYGFACYNAPTNTKLFTVFPQVA